MQARLRPLLALAGALAAAVAAGGCAISTAGDTAQFHYAARAERSITEDDGLPLQDPPVGTRRLADDPREPFSRNYGPQLVMRLRAAFTRLSDAEADALIAHAIAEHEMRRP